MKRILTPLILLGIGICLIYLYSTDANIKSKIDHWINFNSTDSIKKTPSDIASTKNLPAKPGAKREKILKIVKPDKFAHLDKYAKDTPDRYTHDVVVLAEYLEKPAKNEFEKARLIYAWIATHIRYDDDAFNTGNFKNESPDSVLKRRTAVCEGYSSLFKQLGLMMELEVENIVGYAKGYGYEHGHKFSTTDHAWNAIKINDTWHLIDVTWGSSSSTTTPKGLKTKMKFDSYWFCVPPEEFIFSHLPENKDWQLTEPTITLRQYEELPFLNDSFFKMGFDSKETFKKAISGETKEFVEIFSIDYPVRGIDLPYVKKLIKNQEYVFSLESEYLESAAIIDDGQWIFFKRDNNIFSATYSPKGDKLVITTKVNWFDRYFSTIAVYQIVGEKNLTAQNTVSLP